MWALLFGLYFPFAILALLCIASFVCAQVIALEDPSYCCSECTYPDTSQDHDSRNEFYSTVEDTENVNPIVFAKHVQNLVHRHSKSDHLQTFQRRSIKSTPILNHYACPPTSLEALRKRYGTQKSIWGDWSSKQTRQFYKQQLPRALQIDGSLGLSLAERARVASEARHALRVYTRERCHLPARLLAGLYDGLRHLQIYGTWSSVGMNWDDVKLKYTREAIKKLGPCASADDIDIYIYRRIVDRACATNALFDSISLQSQKVDLDQIVNIIKSTFLLDEKIIGKTIYIKLKDLSKFSEKELLEMSNFIFGFIMQLLPSKGLPIVSTGKRVLSTCAEGPNETRPTQVIPQLHDSIASKQSHVEVLSSHESGRDVNALDSGGGFMGSLASSKANRVKIPTIPNPSSSPVFRSMRIPMTSKMRHC